MTEPLVLSDVSGQPIEQPGPTDLVVGIAGPSDAAAFEVVAQPAREGLARAFPEMRIAVVHANAGAPAIAARADALHMMFAATEQSGARGCAVLEADLTGVSAERLQRLLGPIAANEVDFVSARYPRHHFAGTITTSVLYPFLRATYGKRIRNPVSGEFGCSAALVRRYLAADIWRTELARTSIDIELTIQALTSGMRLAQTTLEAKAPTTGDGLDLAGTLARVLGILFFEAERTVAVWQRVRGSEVVRTLGPPEGQQAEPVVLDAARNLELFRLGARTFQEIWTPVLPPMTLLELQKIARQADAEFRFHDALWARIVYDFALAWHLRVMNRDHLLAAFTPLYSGWLASWITEMQQTGAPDPEARVEQLCLRYEAEKPYFISRWRSPDRFSP